MLRTGERKNGKTRYEMKLICLWTTCLLWYALSAHAFVCAVAATSTSDFALFFSYFSLSLLSRCSFYCHEKGFSFSRHSFLSRWRVWCDQWRLCRNESLSGRKKLSRDWNGDGAAWSWPNWFAFFSLLLLIPDKY